MNSEIKPICLNSKGGRNGVEGLQPSLNDRVYDSDGIATACTTSPFFMPNYTAVAMRGRYNENGEVEQQVEISNREVANAITTVQKDSMVAEPQVLVPKRTEYGKAIRKAYESGEIKESRHNMTELQPRTDGIANTLSSISFAAKTSYDSVTTDLNRTSFR